MFNRCIFCQDIIPKECTMCDSCNRLEQEIGPVVEKIIDEYGDVFRKLGSNDE